MLQIGQRVKFNPYYLESMPNSPISSRDLRGEISAVNEYSFPYRGNEYYYTVKWYETDRYSCEIAYRADQIVAIPGRD